MDAEPQNEHAIGATATVSAGAQASVRKSSPLLKPVPTPRIAFPKQLALLRAYASLFDQTGKPVPNADAAAVVDMSAGTVTLANAFFSEVGFLVRSDGGYAPSKPVIDFHRQWQWNQEKAGAELYPLLAQSWFGMALLPKLRVSGSMSEADALAEMSKVANATPDYKGQLETILEYLVEGHVITREAGVIRPASRPASEKAPDPPPVKEDPPPQDPPPSRSHHPFVEGLLMQLPTVGSVWPQTDQDNWIEGWKVALKFLYKTGSPKVVEPPPVPTHQEADEH